MQYPATIAWLKDEEITVNSSDELMNALDRFEVASRSNPWPLLAQITDREGHDSVIGIVDDGAFFEFTSNHTSDEPYRDFVCIGNENAEGGVDFWLLGHHSELSRSQFIPVQAMRNALRYYLETGELSKEVRWLDCSSD